MSLGDLPLDPVLVMDLGGYRCVNDALFLTPTLDVDDLMESVGMDKSTVVHAIVIWHRLFLLILLCVHGVLKILESYTTDILQAISSREV